MELLSEIRSKQIIGKVMLGVKENTGYSRILIAVAIQNLGAGDEKFISKQEIKR
jgi:hypothetical protein